MGAKIHPFQIRKPDDPEIELDKGKFKNLRKSVKSGTIFPGFRKID